MVQAKRNERALEEGEHAYAQRTGSGNKALEGADAILNMRPSKAGGKRYGQHDKEGDDVDKRGAREHAQPLGKFNLVELVVDGDDDAGNRQGADHTHVERLDGGDHGQAGRATNLRGEVDAKEAAPLRKHGIHKVLEGKVANERLHAATRVLLVRQANGQRDGEQQRQLIKDGPTTLKDDVPYAVPHGARRGQRPKDDLGSEERAESDHNARKREQHDRGKHRTSKLLNLLHHGRKFLSPHISPLVRSYRPHPSNTAGAVRSYLFVQVSDYIISYLYVQVNVHRTSSRER